MSAGNASTDETKRVNAQREVKTMEQAQQETETTFTGTYSPEDNKLRLYASERLHEDLYNRVRGAGFIWAPKQGLFVAPMWTPSRADLVMELAGFIGDEETTLEERAAMRAERFEGYQANRAKDAEQALNEHDALKDGDSVIASSDNWRSQRKAQKKADQIERTKQRAIDMWETSEYWESRIKGVTRHAAGRNNTRTLLNRIKKLTAGKRKQEKYIKEATKIIELWTTAKHWKDKSDVITQSKAETIANIYDHASFCFTKDKYPKSDYEGSQSLWGALNKGVITVEQARDLSLPRQDRVIAYAERWIRHYDNRLAYENAILAASGYVEPEKPKRPAQPKMLNYRQPEGFKMSPRGYCNPEMLKIWPQVEMTKAEYKAVYKDWRFTRPVSDHKVRCAIMYDPADKTESGFGRRLLDVVVFLTDSKEHAKP